VTDRAKQLAAPCEPARPVGRILVYGVTGSGKTTLARQVGERTGLPWHPVDDLTWQPGWVAVPDQEQRRRIAAICAGERWVLDRLINNSHQAFMNARSATPCGHNSRTTEVRTRIWP
jgi:adenylate kinase family enzyme